MAIKQSFAGELDAESGRWDRIPGNARDVDNMHLPRSFIAGKSS